MPEKTSPSFFAERYGQLADMDRSFDIAYWQRLGPAAIFDAAWQLVVEAHSQPHRDDNELRLRRSVESFQPQRR
jgi:hypothetical protein